MHGALAELLGDLWGRQVGDFNAVEPSDGAAIVAGAARLDEIKAGAGEEGFRVLLQPALRRHRENESRGAHGAPPQAANSSIEAAKPTAGIGARAPSRVSSPS